MCGGGGAGDSVLDDPESVLYVTTYRLGRRAGDIRALHLSSGTWSVIAGAVMAHDVALDEQSGYLYWATNERSAGVFRLNLRNAAPVEPVVTTGIGAGRRIAIDWLGRHLYVLDSGGVRIVACEMDGTNCVVVIKEDPIQMDGVDWCALALHPESRLMFWSDCSDHISSAGMDGTNRKVIVRGKISLAKGLVVDPALAGRIFWSDEKRSHIESCDLNGKNRLRSKVKTGAPYSIDVLQDTFFWSSPRSGKVFACDKSNCSVPVAVVTMAPASTPSFLYGIHVQHPSKQLRLTNPCSSSACSHACLLSPTSRSGFRCACPAGMELAADDSSCHDSRGHSSLLLSKGAHLFLLQRRLIGKDSLLQLPNPRQSSEDIGSIAYDASADSIVYSRCAPGLNSTSAIYSMNLQTKIEKLLFTGILGCSGFGVDPYTGNVYWTEMDRRQNGHGLVAKGSYYSGRTPQVLVARIESPAVDIVLAPDLHLMFIQTSKCLPISAYICILIYIYFFFFK